MKAKHLLCPLLAASLFGGSAIHAAENESIFIPATGKVVIPHLVLGNDIYYVQLDRMNTPGYNFNLSAPTVVKLTPQPGDDWASAAEIVGNWSIAEIPGAMLSIQANGTFSLTSPAEPDCTAGTETGTWTINEGTGVFSTRALTDTNGDCGLSPPDGAVRVRRSGANMLIRVYDTEAGQQNVMEITAVPL